MIEAKIIEDSISAAGARITTFQLKYPRFIHAEVMTHRVFSRNASSSRAIPVKKVIEQVWNDPAMPIHWGVNQPGMQAKAQLEGFKLSAAKFIWKTASKVACGFALAAVHVGLHKQIANRILEPWQYMHVVLTSTEWANFFALRAHEDAQPEIHKLAIEMWVAMANSKPIQRTWHLPYVTRHERLKFPNEKLLARISAARCCRVSYLKHDGSVASVEEDLALCEKLAGSKPIHASPFEHQAKAALFNGAKSRNFTGWTQFRTFIEQEI